MPQLFHTPKDFTLLTLDAETYYADDYSLSKMPTSSYVRDARFKEHMWGVKVNDGKSFILSPAQAKEFFASLYWPRVAVIGHNLRFDGLILSLHHGVNPGLWVDTLGMARAILKGQLRGHGLDAVSRYIGRQGKVRGKALVNAKNKRDLTHAEYRHMGDYCLDDIEDTWAVFKYLQDRFPTKEYWFLDWSIRMMTEPRLQLHKPLLLEAEQDEIRAKEELLAQVPYKKTQLSSNPQLAQILLDHGVQPPTKVSKTTGKETWDFAKNSIALRELQATAAPEVQMLLEARFAVKSTINETRAAKFAGLADEGRFCVPLNYAGAMNTNRLSGGDGLNVQNLSNGSKLRDAIEAPDGYLVVAIDSSGIELRVAAALAGDFGIIERAEQGADEYALFAADIFGFRVNKAEHPRERKVGKVGVLSLGYQSGATTYRGMLFSMEKLVEPMDVCERVVKLFRARYHHHPRLWRAMDKRLSMMIDGHTPPNLPSNPPLVWFRDGFASTYSGSFVRYPKIHERMLQFGDEEPKKAKVYLDMRKAKATDAEGWASIYGGKCTENASQFLAREVVNYQTHRIWAATGRRPQMQVHDELIYVVEKEKAETFFHVCRKLMSGRVPWWPQLITSASGGVGRTYGEIDH